MVLTQITTSKIDDIEVIVKIIKDKEVNKTEEDKEVNKTEDEKHCKTSPSYVIVKEKKVNVNKTENKIDIDKDKIKDKIKDKMITNEEISKIINPKDDIMEQFKNLGIDLTLNRNEELKETTKQHYGIMIMNLLNDGMSGSNDSKDSIREILPRYLGTSYLEFYPKATLENIDSLHCLYRRNYLMTINPTLNFDRFEKAEQWVFHASEKHVKKLIIDYTNDIHGAAGGIPALPGRANLVIANIAIDWPYAYWLYICNNFPKLKEIVFKVDESRNSPNIIGLTVTQKHDIKLKLVAKNLTRLYIPSLDLFYY